MASVESKVEAMQNGMNAAHDDEPFESAPVLLGTTRHEADPIIKNILVTGGAGFMCGIWSSCKDRLIDSFQCLLGRPPPHVDLSR